MHALGTSGVIWGHFGVILESQCVIKRIRQIRKRLNASVVSNRLQIVLSPNYFAFCTSLIQIPTRVVRLPGIQLNIQVASSFFMSVVTLLSVCPILLSGLSIIARQNATKLLEWL